MKQKPKVLQLFVFSLFFCVVLSAQRERTIFRHYYYDSGVDGLPTNHVGSSVETADGVIWVCTDDGLVRYDSYRFIHYKFDAKNEHSISNNTINCFLEDSNEKCYVGTKIGFNIFERRTGSFRRFLHDAEDTTSIIHNEVLDVIKTFSGQILIATIGGVDVFDPISERFHLIKGISTSVVPRCLLETKDKKVWVGTESGIGLIEDDSFQHYPLVKKGDIPVKVNDLFQDSEGLFWLATGDGLYLFTPETKSYKKVSLGEKFKTIRCSSLIEYPKGKLYIGSHKYGLLHFDTKSHKVIRHYDYLAENRFALSDPYVRGLSLDRRHDLWISTDGGLNVINLYNQEFKVYDNNIIANSKLNYVRNIYIDLQSNIWINTRQGFCRKSELKGEIEPIVLPGYKIYENVAIPSIWEDKNGEVWMVVNNELLKNTKGTNRFTKVFSTSFFKHSVIEKAIIDVHSPDLVWMSTSKGICALNMETQQIKWILPELYLKEVADNRVRRIIQQKNGKLWFATARNLCEYNPIKDEMHAYLINPEDSTSLFSSKIEDMVATKSRIYIAGDKSFSYFEIDKGRFINHTIENNIQMWMPGLAAISLADNGEIWFCGKGEVARFRPETNDVKHYSVSHLTNGCVKKCVFKAPNGNILFGAKTGILVVDPENPPKYNIRPKIKISKCSVFNREYVSDIVPDYLEEVNLNYYQNYFTIGYTCFSYIVKTDMSYVVKMEGIDKDWKNLRYKRNMEYEDMKPGTYTFHVKGLNPDGLESDPLSLHINVHPPFWETYWFYSIVGSIIGFILLLLYSNRKKTILLKKEKKLAEQHAQYKSQFLANMSHEIRTPMNAIMGLNKLLMDSNLDDTQLEYTEAINVSCESLLWIINDILDQAKIESGNLHIKKVPFEIYAIAKQINTLLQNSIKDKKLYFKIDIDEKVPKVLVGDPIRLFQVLTNLIGNSIKFTQRGSILLNISIQERSKNECTLLFEVRDTGVGIPDDKLKHIFESFEQVGNAETSSFYGNRGTGLGLSITKYLIELQGGNIHVESKVGKGSRFFFSLSFKIETEQVAKLTHRDNDRVLPEQLSILLVEDTPINRFLAIELLKKNLSKLAIETAENGKIALNKIKSKRYDLVLMDIKMPVMDGLEATRRIRAMEGAYYQNVPILGLTANAIPQQINECFKVGMNECVTKPIDVEELLDKIAFHVRTVTL